MNVLTAVKDREFVTSYQHGVKLKSCVFFDILVQKFIFVLKLNVPVLFNLYIFILL